MKPQFFLAYSSPVASLNKLCDWFSQCRNRAAPPGAAEVRAKLQAAWLPMAT